MYLRRVARTLLAASMLTIRALFRAARESRITAMATAPNALTSLLLHKVLASRARGHR